MAQNKKEYKDYNILSHQGYTDEYVLEQAGGPMKLAGTPSCNVWMINNEYKLNKEAGIPIEECNRLKVMAQKTVSDVKKSRGY